MVFHPVDFLGTGEHCHCNGNGLRTIECACNCAPVDVGGSKVAWRSIRMSYVVCLDYKVSLPSTNSRDGKTLKVTEALAIVTFRIFKGFGEWMRHVSRKS